MDELEEEKRTDLLWAELPTMLAFLTFNRDEAR